MSHPPSSTLVDQKSLRDSLARVSASHQEFQSFFSKVFDELDGLWADLARRQERWNAQRQAAETDLGERTQRLEQERAELNIQWERVQQQAEANRADAAVVSGENGQQVEQLLETAEQERAALRDAREAAQSQLERLAELSQELAASRTELAETRQEIQAQREAAEQDESQPRPGGDFQERFDQVIAERQELAEERAALETELELVRNQAAELAETIAAERKQSAEERGQGAAELKRMRRLLELIADRSAATPAPGEADARLSGEAAGESSADPVLDSVMAQFEVLQKDLARRRNVKVKTEE